MAVFFDRIDAVPLQSHEFSIEFESWLDNLVDQLNSTIEDIQDTLNGEGDAFSAASKSQAEIILEEPNAPDGTIWYDNDTANNLVIKINGALRQITTTAYP